MSRRKQKAQNKYAFVDIFGKQYFQNRNNGNADITIGMAPVAGVCSQCERIQENNVCVNTFSFICAKKYGRHGAMLKGYFRNQITYDQ